MRMIDGENSTRCALPSPSAENGSCGTDGGGRKKRERKGVRNLPLLSSCQYIIHLGNSYASAAALGLFAVRCRPHVLAAPVTILSIDPEPQSCELLPSDLGCPQLHCLLVPPELVWVLICRHAVGFGPFADRSHRSPPG